jgi:hypothetical protein
MQIVNKPRVLVRNIPIGEVEELGMENEKIRQQLRDAEIASAYPKQTLTDWIKEANEKDMKANDRQVAGEHYKNMRIQPWDVIDSLDHAQAIGFYRGNALKYIMRAGEKGPAREDYEKARHYLDKLLEIL